MATMVTIELVILNWIIEANFLFLMRLVAFIESTMFSRLLVGSMGIKCRRYGLTSKQ